MLQNPYKTRDINFLPLRNLPDYSTFFFKYLAELIQTLIESIVVLLQDFLSEKT